MTIAVTAGGRLRNRGRTVVGVTGDDLVVKVGPNVTAAAPARPGRASST